MREDVQLLSHFFCLSLHQRFVRENHSTTAAGWEHALALVRKLKLRQGTNTVVLFGHHDRHLKLIEEDLGLRLSDRSEELTLDGTPDATRHAERVLTELATLANDDVLSVFRQSPETPIKELLSNPATIVNKKPFVAPKTPTQKAYIEATETLDIVIGIGPMTVNALLN